jgi:galactan endo-1,6-beta-galactosidase
MDIHGYWVNPQSEDPTSASWDWSVDLNQRTMMQKARERGANLFELFSDSPMWWMNFNRSTAGSDDGGNCLKPENYDRFALYLATVARYAADHWQIKFTSVEPFNEPSADWWKWPQRQEGCHFDRSTQQTMIGKLRAALDRANLRDVAAAASDENDVDVGLATWNSFDANTRAAIGKVNVHGYYRGTEPYRGTNRTALHQAVNGKRLWQSEYGENDASGLTLAQSIVLDVRNLRPTAWVYWQPVEPGENGWGLLLAKYTDTGDQLNANAKTELVRANRKFFVYGQFTRYIRPGYHIIDIDDQNSIAAYDASEQKLVILTASGDTAETVRYDLSKFSALGTIQLIATTTAPGGNIPDWTQHPDTVALDSGRKSFTATLHPKSVYTFVISGAVVH